MPKKTPWFPFSTPPVRPGVYNVSCRHENQSGLWYGRFDGERWSIWWHARRGHRKAIIGASMSHGQLLIKEGTWRGLTKEAK